MKKALDRPARERDVPSHLARRILIVGIGTMTLLFVLLLATIFYVQFPTVTHTGDAQLQKWIGADATQIVGLLLGLLFGGCYLAIAIRGTCEQETAQAWKLGAAGGAGAGIVMLLLYSITGLNATSPGELTIVVVTFYGFVLLGSLFIGFLAGKSEGWISAGTIAGFWFSTILTLLAALGLLGRDTLFAHHLASTAWVGDQFGDMTCKGATGSKLIGCEVGDDLGFTANSFLVFPLLGLLLGAGGGILGRFFTRQRTVRVMPWNAALVTPLIGMGGLLIIFVAEIIWNIW